VKKLTDQIQGTDSIINKYKTSIYDGLRNEKACWSIGRWSSIEDKQANVTYSPQEAQRLFGIKQHSFFLGNVLLNTGINELFRLICSTSGTKWDNATAQLLVGDATTAEAVTQTSLDAVKSRTAWAAATAYALGGFVRPTTVDNTNEFVYECTTAGTSGATEPTWPTTDGATVTDGTTLVWTARKRISAVGMMAGFPTFGTAQKAVWKSSFDGTTANYDWNEFAVRNGAIGLICLNRAVGTQGTKVSGQVWELELQITLA